MDGPHRRLDGKGDEEREEHEQLGGTGCGDGARHVLDEEALFPARAVHECGHNTHEHDETTSKGVEEELQCCCLALRPAVGADEEVHRDEHRFEKDVEEEDVARRKDGDHDSLERENPRDVTSAAATGCFFVHREETIAVSGQDHEGDEENREADHDGAHAIDAPRKGGTNRWNPRIGFR